MKFPAFVGPSYTAQSSALADEECINLYAETNETAGAQSQRSYLGTPGLSVFTTFPDGPERGNIWAGERLFCVSADVLYEVASDGTQTVRGNVDTDGNPVSMAFNSIQVLIVSAGRAFCFTLATNTLTEVTSLLAGTPVLVVEADTYFTVMFAASNKFQVSQVLDGTVWPGLQVSEVSVFPENISSIVMSHRELWVLGERHAQPYQNTGSQEVYDVIPGALLEMGCAATYGAVQLDNTVFWVGQDDRGALVCFRANGYNPQRVSTHAVEYSLGTYTQDQITNLVSYTYQESGHLFWLIYIAGTDCTWVYDIAEGLWHKRAEWLTASATFGPHRSWNHVYAFGKHLMGDWQSGNLYELSAANLDDFGENIRSLRRSPTVNNEMKWLTHSKLTMDFETGVTPQPPFTDGSGNPRPAEVMLRWSDDHGETWSNVHTYSLGFAGEYQTRVIAWRLGRSRYRVYEMSITDPVKRALVDAYLELA